MGTAAQAKVWGRALTRAVGDDPIEAHIYVTDNCNLDCHYCTEYDNSVPHPKLSDLKKWITKLAELRIAVINLQGGEPLMHPDILEIIRFCKSLKLGVTMSTNGFLLTEEMVKGLEESGLDSLQISVDRMTPIPSTRKSLKTILPKIEHLKKSKLAWHISGVLFDQTVDEARQLVEWGLENDISAHARLVHTGRTGGLGDGVTNESKEKLLEFLDWQWKKKRAGDAIHTSAAILQYQKDMLEGREPEWTCTAGFKHFFVSAEGKFWLCSMKQTPNIDIMDVTPEYLRSFYKKKDCQKGCGVWCVIGASLFYEEPTKFLATEARDRVQGGVARIVSKIRGGGSKGSQAQPNA